MLRQHLEYWYGVKLPTGVMGSVTAEEPDLSVDQQVLTAKNVQLSSNVVKSKSPGGLHPFD